MTRFPLPAVVLTAGLGTRLDPLTRLVAKPAVPLGARTLVEHVLDWLRSQHVTDLVLNLHHRPETITGVVGDGAHLGMRVRYSWEGRILGSAGGPKRAASLLDSRDVLIVNGDTLCRIDLAAMLASHQRTGAEATLAIVPNPSPSHYNGIVCDAEDRLLSIVPKGRATAGTWHFVGVQIVNTEIFAALPDDVASETTGELYPKMMAERPGSLRGWKVDAPFVDVGTPRDYLEAVSRLGARDRMSEPRQGCIVWPDARVAPDAVIEHCIVAGPVVLPPGFRATQSVLVPASVLRNGEHVPTICDVAVFPLDGHPLPAS
jgi:mannose-1-phosphate guanylyltransferase